MSMKEDYASYLAQRKNVQENPMADVFLNQEKRYVHPFHIYGNIWYVGDSWVCVHLIDTGDGLLLIDSGNLGSEAMLVHAIWEAGFNPADVKWIIHSHGHVDHIGASEWFKRMFGTKLYIGAPDAKWFRDYPERTYIQDARNAQFVLFQPDYEIQDGDVLTFGNTTITFRLTPGHSDGVISCFFDAYEGEDVKRCGYYGGFGFNTLQKAYLQEIGDTTLSMRQTYLDSLAKVRNEKVEIFLGNHCINNDTLGKHKQQLENPDGPNPFIDPELWGKYLDMKRDDLLKFMADPKNN